MDTNPEILEMQGLYEVLADELHHDGAVLRRGAVVELTARQAAPLLAIDVIDAIHVSNGGDMESVAGADGTAGARKGKV